MRRWGGRSGIFLLSSVILAEVTSESLVGALDGGSGVGLALVNDGAGTLGPY